MAKCSCAANRRVIGASDSLPVEMSVETSLHVIIATGPSLLLETRAQLRPRSVEQHTDVSDRQPHKLTDLGSR